MAELGEALRLEKSVSSGLIDRAEARELVTRCAIRTTGGLPGFTDRIRQRPAQRFHGYVSSELNALAVDLPDRTTRQLTAAMWQIVSAQDVSAIFGCAAPTLPETPLGGRASLASRRTQPR